MKLALLRIADIEEDAIQVAAELLNSAPGLAELYATRNGFYAFEASLHVFPLGGGSAPVDLVSWNAEGLWRAEYAEMAEGLVFFGEDAFGDQFCFKDGRIHLFHSETGEVEFMAEDLENWARLILDDFVFLQGTHWHMIGRVCMGQ